MSAMTADAVRSAVLDALLDVAPDVDTRALDATRPFREQFDFDSMDQLNFVVGLHKRFGVDVPETDYAELATLAGCVAYLSRAVGGGP
jgi:acyl carrier protein